MSSQFVIIYILSTQTCLRDVHQNSLQRQIQHVVKSTILSKYAFEADWVSQTNRLLCYYVVLRSRAVTPACATHSDVEEFLRAEITLREQTSTETNKCLLNIKICIINIEA